MPLPTPVDFIAEAMRQERDRILTEAKRLRDEAMKEAEFCKKTEPDHPKWITYAGQASGIQSLIFFIEELED